MENFLRYFFQDVGRVMKAFLDVIIDCFNFLNYLLNFPMRMKILEEHYPEFNTLDWVLLVVAWIILIVFIAGLLWGILKLIRRIFRFRIPVKKYDEVVRQVQNLQRDLIRANYEKDKLLAMRVAELGGPDLVEKDQLLDALYKEDEQAEVQPEGLVAEPTQTGNRNTMLSPCINPSDSRFFRLTEVDNYYKTQYVQPVYDDQITLEEFCEKFRLFACSKLRLFYDLRLIRHFIASFGAARIVILQGISGTGKTSLPYAFGKFVQKDTTVVSVQPAWRERTELYGYFNEFTKRYTETDFLSAIYEGNFYRDPHIIILDEMNIARVEYYFAEMLSILEMPLESEWKIDIVNAMWDTDPCKIQNGKVLISNNVWFVGTINNDDSTFAVADKVYDRAIPIDLDAKADPFECEMTEAVNVSTDRLNELFAEAKRMYPVSQEVLDKLEVMNTYLINTFKLAFGNRIMKQLKDYVPCYIACGGTEMEAVDFMVAKKVLRKFESLSLGFMLDELARLNNFLDKTFGKDTMKICKEYINHLRKTN